MSKKRRKTQRYVGGINANTTVPIVSDAAIATSGLGEGRLIPLVIIDTSEHKNIEDLVKAHEKLPPGDAEIWWGWEKGSKDSVSLIIDFKRPAQTTVHLCFNIIDRGGLVDLILNAKSLYIQPGRKGDRLKRTLNNPRILVEIPDTGFKYAWVDKWNKATYKKFRNWGLSRAKAKIASHELVKKLRETFSSFRIK